MFPRGDALCRTSLRRTNLFSIACELCCRMMLYKLFNNSLVPCSPRLAHNNWKQCKVSGCKFGDIIEGPIGGIEIYPLI